MDLNHTYAVSYQDFLASIRQYRRRSRWSSFVYYFDVWVIPGLGLATALTYCYGLANHNESIVYLLDYLAVLGIIAAIGLPVLYQLRLRQTYKRRIVLAEGGRVRLAANDSTIQFIIQDKADIRYEWSALSDFSEKGDVLTLFVQKAAFHTIPKHDLSEEDWRALNELVSTHVRKI